jgi:translation initiation factor 5A
MGRAKGRIFTVDFLFSLRRKSYSTMEKDAKEGFTYPLLASAFRIGHVMLFEKRYPCRIVEMKTSKTGKHGSCKITFVGIDIFSRKKHREMSPSTHNMLAVTMKKEKYQVLCIEEEWLRLIDDQDKIGPEIELKSLSTDISDQIRKDWLNLEGNESLVVTVLSAMGKSTIQEFKVQSG